MTASLYARFYLLPSALRRLFLMLAVGAIVLESFWPGHAVSHSPWMSFLANLMHPLLYGTFAFAVLLRLDSQAPLRASARGAVLAIVGLVGGWMNGTKFPCRGGMAALVIGFLTYLALVRPFGLPADGANRCMPLGVLALFLPSWAY
jgi:hypothetical protein